MEEEAEPPPLHRGDIGIYMAQKIAKQQLDNEHSYVSKSKIFSGCIIHVNGYTSPTYDEIKVLVCENGGKFVTVYESFTHIVCNSFTDAQLKNGYTTRNSIKYVTDRWVVDSVHQNQKLKEENYKPEQLQNRDGRNISDFYKFNGNSNSSSSSSSAAAGGSINSSSSGINNSICRTKDFQNCEEDPEGFIKSYFLRSRLHFIGTWRSRLDDLVATMQKNSHEVLLQQQKSGLKKYILHVDMDCFFVSALIRDEVESFKDQPLAVAHSSGNTSEISSCNYAARAKGVSNGSWMKSARIKCPELKVLHYDFDLYETVSNEVYTILFESAATVEPVSVDEAYLEIYTGTPEQARQLGQSIRDKIKLKTRCPASVGIGANKLVARIATKFAKPDGLRFIENSESPGIFRNLEIGNLPGVGYRTKEKLQQNGILKCGDITKDPNKYNTAYLKAKFGESLGQFLHDACRGIDHSEVKLEQSKKSIGSEVNWGIRFTNFDKSLAFLAALSRDVKCRLSGLRSITSAKSLEVKLKIRPSHVAVDTTKYMGHGECDDISKSKPFSKSISSLLSSNSISDECTLLYRELMKGRQVEDLRGVGIHIKLGESSRPPMYPMSFDPLTNNPPRGNASSSSPPSRPKFPDTGDGSYYDSVIGVRSDRGDNGSDVERFYGDGDDDDNYDNYDGDDILFGIKNSSSNNNNIGKSNSFDDGDDDFSSNTYRGNTIKTPISSKSFDRNSNTKGGNNFKSKSNNSNKNSSSSSSSSNSGYSGLLTPSDYETLHSMGFPEGTPDDGEDNRDLYDEVKGNLEDIKRGKRKRERDANTKILLEAHNAQEDKKKIPKPEKNQPTLTQQMAIKEFQRDNRIPNGVNWMSNEDLLQALREQKKLDDAKNDKSPSKPSAKYNVKPVAPSTVDLEDFSNSNDNNNSNNNNNNNSSYYPPSTVLSGYGNKIHDLIDLSAAKYNGMSNYLIQSDVSAQLLQFCDSNCLTTQFHEAITFWLHIYFGLYTVVHKNSLDIDDCTDRPETNISTFNLMQSLSRWIRAFEFDKVKYFFRVFKRLGEDRGDSVDLITSHIQCDMKKVHNARLNLCD